MMVGDYTEDQKVRKRCHVCHFSWRFILILVVLCFFQSTASISTTATTDDDSVNSLYTDCGDDLSTYCPTATTTSTQLSCLYDHQDQVSPSCQSFLTTTTPGGCNTDAQKYCSQYTSVDDISDCLDNELDQISVNCYRNIQNYSGSLNQQQRRLRRMTQVVSVLGMLLLAVLLMVVKIIFRRVRGIQAEDEEVLQSSPTDLLPLSHGKSVGDIERDEDNNHVELEENQEKESWCISFHELTYYAYEPFDWLHPLQKKKKAILNQV